MPNGFVLLAVMVAGAAWGMLLGLLYFGGLWVTVRRLPMTPYPIQLSIASLVLRLGLSLTGFALLLKLSQPTLLPLVGCVAAFFWTRNRMVQRLGGKPL